MERTDPARVLLVDEHAFFRRGLRRVLSAHGVEVVGEAETARSALDLVRRMRPDVVLLDPRMRDASGPTLIGGILAIDPHVRVLVVGLGADTPLLLDALLAGGCGSVLKDAEPEELVAAVRLAVAGECMISSRVARQLVERLRESTAGLSPRRAQHDGALSPRETEILRLIADGKENSAIATELFISPKTVKNHVASILEKLDIENRIQAAVFAVRTGVA